MKKGSAESVIRRAFSLFSLSRPQRVSGFGLRADHLSPEGSGKPFGLPVPNRLADNAPLMVRPRFRPEGRPTFLTGQKMGIPPPGRATYFLHAQKVGKENFAACGRRDAPPLVRPRFRPEGRPTFLTGEK